MINIKKFFSKENIINFLIIFFIFVLDRITKILVIKNQTNDNGNLFINKFLNIELVWNSGIGFGLFNLEANLGYHLFTLLIFSIIILIFYLMINSGKSEKILYSIILGGACGNFYDRLTYFSVPDFIDLHFGNYHWFTFNIADIFISIGVLFLLMIEIFNKKKKN